jgi:chaperonin GroES
MSKLKIKPLGDKILVKPLEKEEKTKSGIVLPDTAKEKPQEGEVLAVGKGKYIDDKLIPLEVKVGDRIIFSKYSPTEIKVAGEELYILSEADILAVYEK